MLKYIFLAMSMFLFDSDVEEKLVVKSRVDLIEFNHKYHRSEEDGKTKKMFMQVIFWEYRNSLLLPEYKEGVKTGNWHRGSGFVVVDYITVYNLSYAVPVKKAGVAYDNGGCQVYYYDTDSRCYRIVSSKNFRTTHTLYDPEIKNQDIVVTDKRTELVKPRRYKGVKKQLPQEVLDLIDMEINIREQP
jgi:hypothetical protein